MVSLLKAHALADIWCEPQQDHQHVIQPARITHNGGAFRRASVLWESLPLPNADLPLDLSVYHVYQIGQLPPAFFNILSIAEDQMSRQNVALTATSDANGDFQYAPSPAVEVSVPVVAKPRWHRVSDVCAANGAVIDVYIENGARLPRHECWLLRNKDKNFLLAVKDWPELDLGKQDRTDPYTNEVYRVPRTLDGEKVTIRFYTNALGDTNVQSLSVTVNNSSDFNGFLAYCNAVETNYSGYGFPIYQVDGFTTSKPTGYSTALNGKVLSFFWESAIKAVSFFPLQSLFQFDSLLDVGKRKYALVRDASYDMIDYHDDVDVYVVSKTGTTFTGVYLDRSRDNSLRMLTHNAYSVRKDLVDALIAENPELFQDASKRQLMVVVREGGKQRGLVHQHSRIEELYRLSYAQIVEAICTNSSDIPEWTAVELERSAYCRIMGLSAKEITDILVEDAYGYNAATRKVANPVCPTVLNAGRTYFTTPQVTQMADIGSGAGRRSMFCYDASGAFIGWFSSTDRLEFVQLPFSLNAATRVECFNAKTSGLVDGTYYDSDIESHDLAQYGFRCYACPIVGGVPNENWADITNTPYYIYDPYGDAGNGYTPRLTWNTAIEATADMSFCVKIGGNIHLYVAPFPETAPDPFSGFIRFNVQSETNLGGSTAVRDQALEPGCIDVFMDGESLIEDLDYYVQWPTIVIVKRPKTDPTETQILVRSYGYCDEQTMQHFKPREVGFVRGGILSVGCHYDVRNDRNTRIVVAGNFKDRDQVMFAEGYGTARSTDGRPYSLTDYILPVEGYTTKFTNPYRKLSLDLDQRVSDYLTERLPTIHPLQPTIVSVRWDVFSPFCSAIIHALINGDIDSVPLAAAYTDGDIAGWVTPWLDLLPFDPCTKIVDRNYVHIYPHPFTDLMTLTSVQYRFVERVISLYLNNQVDLSPMVKIG